MSFLSFLKNLFSHREDQTEQQLEAERKALRDAWGLDVDDPVIEETPAPELQTDPTGKAYDENLWRNKLIRTATSQREIQKPEFGELLSALFHESQNLGFPPDFVFQSVKDAYQAGARAVVADRRISHSEHIYLDQLKDILGLPDDMAKSILETVIREAEEVFKTKITKE